MTMFIAPTPDQLKEFRERNGLSQQQAASSLGCAVATYRSWEQGATVPTGRHLLALQRLLSSDQPPNTDIFERPDRWLAFSSAGTRLPFKPPAPSLDEEITDHLQGLGTILRDPWARLDIKRTIIESILGHTLVEIPEIIRFDRSPWEQFIEKAFSELPPRPKTSEEKAGRDQTDLTFALDRAISARLLQEAEDRGLTPSGLLEVILWNYLGKPKLSFEKDTSSAQGTTESQDPGQDSEDDPSGSDHETDV